MKGFNDKLLSRGETIGVALSGGEDSVCLLYFLLKNQKKFGIKVVAVNVEHGIRGEASIRDTQFCRQLCKGLSVPFKSYAVKALEFSAQNHLSIEEGARRLRYDCFFDAINQGFCHKIACAHHLDDNAETVLFNIFRGATVSGAKGILESSYDGRIIRPFLQVSKKDIVDYINKNNLKYITDETNQDNDYTRNYIRNQIFPLIEERFPFFKTSISRFAKSCKSDDDYLYKIAEENLVFKDGACYIPCGLSYPVFSRCAIMAIKRLGTLKDFDNRHIEALFQLTVNISGKKLDLLNNLYAIKEGQFIAIKPKTENKAFCTPFKIGRVVLPNYLINITKVKKFVPNDGALYLDRDKIPESAVIRSRQTGDRFTKFSGGTVTLKKYLTDKKIPADKKAVIPVIAVDNLVYCVIGVEISDLVKIDDSTKNIIKISVKNILGA